MVLAGEHVCVSEPGGLHHVHLYNYRHVADEASEGR